MNCVRDINSLLFKRFALIGIVLLGLFGADSITAQNDPFGQIDYLSIDSVQAAPGQDVTVGVRLRNDEGLNSFSIPLTYDPALLSIKSVSFANSRTQHINYRIITPSDISSIDGHFLVTVLKVYEDPISPGDGALFTVTFTVSGIAPVGASLLIDTLFFPPGGSLLLADDSLNYGIIPEFRAGKIVVREQNRRPMIHSLPDQYVVEGDSLVLDVSASDPDGDPMVLAVTSKPTGARFVDHSDGTGRFVWRPDYVGPFSADGSPYTVSFWVTDGDLSAEESITVEVINKNRRPHITHPGGLTIDAGESLEFVVSAIDPDFESIGWELTGLPSGATFNGKNPGSVAWHTAVTDSGSFEIGFIATDPHGFADSGTVSIQVRSATLYALTLDTVLAYPNEKVSYDVTLENQLPVSSFNLLIHYDASVLNVLDVSGESTRADQFEYFHVVYNENGSAGDVRITGIADLSGSGSEPLTAGVGPIVTFQFLVSGNLSFVGMDIPLGFRFLDGFTKDDNTLTDESGDKIEQTEIAYADGAVRIRDYGKIKLGDINLNGLAYEISDAIYFSNYFMNPILYAFTPLQFANSDVNKDNIAATVADLVTLINIVVSGGAGNKSFGGGELSAVLESIVDNDRVTLKYQADFPIGGVLVTFNAGAFLDPDMIELRQDQMIYDFSQEGRKVRLLVYSLDGASMPAGAEEFITIADGGGITIEDIDMASLDGQRVKVQLGAPPALMPERFQLYQNYPNPFNPETNLAFDLNQAGLVNLTIFNALGQKVKTVVDQSYPAGHHEVVWHGRDDNNAKVASGVYFYRLTTESQTETRKMVLMK